MTRRRLCSEMRETRYKVSKGRGRLHVTLDVRRGCILINVSRMPASAGSYWHARWRNVGNSNG